MFFVINIINIIFLWLIPEDFKDIKIWGILIPIGITIGPIRATVAASDIKLVTKPEKLDIPTHIP